MKIVHAIVVVVIMQVATLYVLHLRQLGEIEDLRREYSIQKGVLDAVIHDLTVAKAELAVVKGWHKRW